jgi:hypothetical protein
VLYSIGLGAVGKEIRRDRVELGFKITLWNFFNLKLITSITVSCKAKRRRVEGRTKKTMPPLQCRQMYGQKNACMGAVKRK